MKYTAILAFTFSISSNILYCKNKFDPAFKAVFGETQVTQVDSKKPLPADIAYFFADIKYKDGKIKICEFGNGVRASVADSQVIYNGTLVNIETPYWPIFWEYVQKLNKPIWVVGNRKQGISNENINRVNDIDLISTSTPKDHVKKLRPKAIDKCEGIVIYQYLDTWNPVRKKKLELFIKNHPEFLVVNRSTIRFSYNKIDSANILDATGLSNLKPHWKKYPKKYTPELAKQILDDMGSNVVVIKPISSRQANGILMVEAADLDASLKALFSKNYSIKKYIPNHHDAETFAYWETEPNDVFMVESCEDSKKINVRGNWYNPTMRLVFILRHDNGQIFTNIIGGYWKIPPRAISDPKASLTEKYKTIPMHHVVKGYTGLKIEEADFIEAKSVMYKVLPQIYESMLTVTTKSPSTSYF